MYLLSIYWTNVVLNSSENYSLVSRLQLALSIPIPGEEKSDKVTKATTQEVRNFASSYIF